MNFKALIVGAIAFGAGSQALAQSISGVPPPASMPPTTAPASTSAPSKPAAPRAPAASSGDVYAMPLSTAALPEPQAGVSSLDAALPPEAVARSALESHPNVVAARARLDFAKAQADRLRAGEYETIVEGASGVRRVADYYATPGRAPGATVVEGYVGLQRGVRLPAKAALDERNGDLGIQVAADEVDDARHQTGLALADAWFNWVQASAAAKLDRSAVDGATKALAAMHRRVELKDAAPLELQQVEAASAIARAKAEMSAGDALSARISLEAGFPELPLPAVAPMVPEPVDAPSPLGGWQQAIVSRSHEIRIAELKAEQQRAVADRAGLDRRADPTFGVRAFSEQGNREHGVQVTVSIPFGGARRSAVFAGELARTSDLEAQAAKVRRDILALAGSDVAAMSSRLRAWRATKLAQSAAEISARLQLRAYQLGEKDLSDTLLANGQFYQAMRAEIDARTEAWRAISKLRLDAHALWADVD